MQDNIYQLYHVARCGSTLLSSILSTVVETYTEPPWARDVLQQDAPLYRQTHAGKLIKFPSLVLMKPIPSDLGKKVFLYRPLNQHLYKIKHVEDMWKKHRCEILREFIRNNGYPSEIVRSNWKPSTDMELIAYQWLCSIFEMNKHSDVLWVRSNEFFLNKVKTVNLVTEHFNLPTVKKYDYVNVNVKRLKINGTDSPCEITHRVSQSPNDVECVLNNHGVIESNCSNMDHEIASITADVCKEFPTLAKFLY
jgi:hypothetical protein